MEAVEFANLNRLSGVLKKSKSIMDGSDVPAQNKHVFEHSTRANGFIDSVSDYEKDEKPIPNLTEQYYAKMSGSGGSGSVFDFDEEDLSNSKLPKEILEVMKKGQKDREKLGVTSKIDQSLISEVNNKKPSVVKEEEKPVSGGVDYSLIKMIVEDCMKKYTATLKKTLINESKSNSSLELMTQQGNTFKFVTTDGKIFEGKLTYKGNINK